MVGFSFYYGDKKFTIDDFCNDSTGYFCDLGEGVSAKAIVREIDEFDAYEWLLTFKNLGSKNSFVFGEINDCDINYEFIDPKEKVSGYMPQKGFPAVTVMNGMVSGSFYEADDKMSAEEFAVKEEYFTGTGAKHYENTEGRSSAGIMPFFDCHTEFNGVIVAIGWSGNWRADFIKEKNYAQIKTGLKNAQFYLEPGEEIRTTSTLVMKYDSVDKYNKFRALIKKYFSHNSKNNKICDSLLAFELWGSVPSTVMIERINQLKQYDIKFDEIWIDAGWYGEGEIGPSTHDQSWNKQTGDYRINPYVHPKLLKDVEAAANSAGSRLMLWIEPERAHRGTPLTIEHPDWFIEYSKEDDTLLLNYGNEQAWNYVYDMISNHVVNLNLSCYRQDFNTGISTYCKNNDVENRVGITEIKHITGMYKLWDKLHERFPYLLIDNCASGGRRIDIETLKRSIIFFRSDYQCNFNENSDVLQVHNSGASKYLPYNGCTTKTKNDLYALRSSYSSSWGCACYSTIFQQMNEDDFIILKNVVDEYKAIRQYFSCEYYNHCSEKLDDTSWTIWQYHDNESNSGIVLSFRRAASPFDKVTIKLKGIDVQEVEYYDFDKKINFTGNMVLNLELPHQHSSSLIKYTVKKKN